MPATAADAVADRVAHGPPGPAPSYLSEAQSLLFNGLKRAAAASATRTEVRARSHP